MYSGPRIATLTPEMASGSRAVNTASQTEMTDAGIRNRVYSSRPQPLPIPQGGYEIKTSDIFAAATAAAATTSPPPEMDDTPPAPITPAQRRRVALRTQTGGRPPFCSPTPSATSATSSNYNSDFKKPAFRKAAVIRPTPRKAPNPFTAAAVEALRQSSIRPYPKFTSPYTDVPNPFTLTQNKRTGRWKLSRTNRRSDIPPTRTFSPTDSLVNPFRDYPEVSNPSSPVYQSDETMTENDGPTDAPKLCEECGSLISGENCPCRHVPDYPLPSEKSKRMLRKYMNETRVDCDCGGEICGGHDEGYDDKAEDGPTDKPTFMGEPVGIANNPYQCDDCTASWTFADPACPCQQWHQARQD